MLKLDELTKMVKTIFETHRPLPMVKPWAIKCNYSCSRDINKVEVWIFRRVFPGPWLLAMGIKFRDCVDNRFNGLHCSSFDLHIETSYRVARRRILETLRSSKVSAETCRGRTKKSSEAGNSTRSDLQIQFAKIIFHSCMKSKKSI